jgi:GTP pyrophosphokinase
MDKTQAGPRLGERFDRAFLFASRLHARQVRKGTSIPYIAHLLAVASLVIEDGGDEDEAIAGLLHDAVEDQGGKPTLERIRQDYGEKVAAIVEGCTDADVTPKPPWYERKVAYIAHLRVAGPSIRRVSVADKVHNARAILADYRQIGGALWERFNGGRDGTLWYYRALADVFLATNTGPLAAELDRVVREVERLVGAAPDHAQRYVEEQATKKARGRAGGTDRTDK